MNRRERKIIRVVRNLLFCEFGKGNNFYVYFWVESYDGFVKGLYRVGCCREGGDKGVIFCRGFIFGWRRESKRLN